MRIHIINENKLRGEVIGSAFWHGRGWLHVGKGYHSIFHAEWSFLRKAKWGPTCEMELGDGDSQRDIKFHFALPWLFSVFLIFEDILPKNTRFGSHNNARRMGFAWYEWTLTLHLWSVGGMGDWSSRDPWYLHGIRFDFDRILFGRRSHFETNDTGFSDCVIPMPEGAYPAKIRLYTSNWKGRWGTKRLRRAEIKCEQGVPCPGKGENSWDCDENATYGITCPANNEWDAIGELVASVLRDRYKYGGGCNWRPEAKMTG